MRPLAVLILVLGAAAALLFAVTSLSDSAERDALASGPAIAKPATATDRGPVSIDPPVIPLDVDGEPEEVETRVEAPFQGPEITGAYSNWIEGYVLDPQGLPVADAEIELFERQVVSQFADVIRVMNGAPEGVPYKTTKTSGDGSFRFSTLKPGPTWTIAVLHESYSRKEVGPIDVPEQGGISEEIVLDAGYVLQGYVREELTGAPVMGAIVTLENPALIYVPSNQRGTAEKMQSETDDRGYYRFANINPGQRAIMCMAPGYGTQIKYNVNFAGSSDKNLEEDFQLKTAMLIAGRVIGPDREPVEGITIDAIGNSHEPGCRSTAISKAGGEFVLEALNEGFYTLRPLAEGWDVDPVLRVEAGRTDVEIQLFEQGALLGKVIDAATSRPITDFTCTIRKLNKQSKAWGAMVAKANFKGEKNGSFKMGGISEGTYVVQADARGYASSFSEEFTVTQGMTTPDVVVRMTRGGTLKGRVLDAYSGAPIANALVATNDNNYIDSEFTNLLVGLQPSAVTKTKVKTDAEGRFEIKLITPETYQVKIQASDYTQHVMNDVRLGDGLTTDVGLLKLSKGASVSGTVFGEDGKPAAGCNVSLSRQDNRLWGNVQGRTNAQGEFVLRNAPPGQYKLAAARPRDGQENPFITILDMKNSEVLITIVDGQDLKHDLFLQPQ